MEDDLEELARKCREHGARDYAKGYLERHNPYRSNYDIDVRSYWLEGWLEAKRAHDEGNKDAV